MANLVDENAIEKDVMSRLEDLEDFLEIKTDWLTPAGRQRSIPMYETTVINEYSDEIKTIKAKSQPEVEQKAKAQLTKWAEQEIKKRILGAKKDAKEEATSSSEMAQAIIESIREILRATLAVDDKLKWEELLDQEKFPPFHFRKEPEMPASNPPVMPAAPFWGFLLQFFRRRWEEKCKELNSQYQVTIEKLKADYDRATKEWGEEKKKALEEHKLKKQTFEAEQAEKNQRVHDFRKRFEEGEMQAVIEYINAVFERSNYPEAVSLDYTVAYESSSKTLVADVVLPVQDVIPDIIEYRYLKSSNEMKPIKMKKKEHDELYDSLIKQIIIRTIHEIFESVYTPHVQAAVVNGWVTYVDRATGHDVTSCIISVSSERKQFESFNLERIDPTECVKSLKGLIAGPLSNVAPVRPILQLNRQDPRFIESKEMLAELNATTNLAEIPWEDFEHLVRELFGKMFSAEGAEVRVTQSSRDQGVDAIAFDPDPIRGGKFVIQAKRYTNVVGVSAVRDLYGTMINEGAVKGILVTTAYYGPDSREFAKDKPITLIDGSNLVYLLEQYGYKVRIDIEAAKIKQRMDAIGP